MCRVAWEEFLLVYDGFNRDNKLWRPALSPEGLQQLPVTDRLQQIVL